MSKDESSILSASGVHFSSQKEIVLSVCLSSGNVNVIAGGKRCRSCVQSRLSVKETKDVGVFVASVFGPANPLEDRPQ